MHTRHRVVISYFSAERSWRRSVLLAISMIDVLQVKVAPE